MDSIKEKEQIEMKREVKNHVVVQDVNNKKNNQHGRHWTGHR